MLANKSVRCLACGQEHRLERAQNGWSNASFYTCGGKTHVLDEVENV